MLLRLLTTTSLALPSCTNQGNIKTETPTATPDRVAANDNDGIGETEGVPKHYPHGYFGGMETPCGLELIAQGKERFVRARLPIVGLEQRPDYEAVFDGGLLSIELAVRSAEDLGASGLREGALLPVYQESQRKRAREEQPELASTTQPLSSSASTESFIDHWELVSRDKAQKRHYVDGLARIYTVVAVEDLVFSMITYAFPDDPNVASVHAGFVKTLRIEAGAADLHALQSALQQQAARDPECHAHPAVIRVEESSEP
jgi:hypothetical protein